MKSRRLASKPRAVHVLSYFLTALRRAMEFNLLNKQINKNHDNHQTNWTNSCNAIISAKTSRTMATSDALPTPVVVVASPAGRLRSPQRLTTASNRSRRTPVRDVAYKKLTQTKTKKNDPRAPQPSRYPSRSTPKNANGGSTATRPRGTASIL